MSVLSNPYPIHNMQIKSSLDWSLVSITFDQQIKNLAARIRDRSMTQVRRDLYRVLDNIDSMVSQLSAIEVESRAGRGTKVDREVLLSEVNKSITMLKQELLMLDLRF